MIPPWPKGTKVTTRWDYERCAALASQMYTVKNRPPLVPSKPTPRWEWVGARPKARTRGLFINLAPCSRCSCPGCDKRKPTPMRFDWVMPIDFEVPPALADEIAKREEARKELEAHQPARWDIQDPACRLSHELYQEIRKLWDQVFAIAQQWTG